MNIWYMHLIKPPLTPPAAYFPAAWGILYIMIAASLIIVLTKQNSKQKLAVLLLFFIQLVFNILWSYIFFEMKSIQLALIDVTLLLIFLILTVIKIFKLSKIAGWLLVPYLLQVIFATYLNTGLLILNSKS